MFAKLLHSKPVGEEMLPTAQTFHPQKPAVPLSSIFARSVGLKYSETGWGPIVNLDL